MKKIIIVTAQGASGKIENILIDVTDNNITEHRTYEESSEQGKAIRKILDDKGYSDFKINDWEFMKILTVLK